MTTMLDRALPTASLSNSELAATSLEVLADVQIFVLPDDWPRGQTRYHGTLVTFRARDPELDKRIACYLWTIPHLYKLSQGKGARLVSLTAVGEEEVLKSLEVVAQHLGVPLKVNQLRLRHDTYRCHDLAVRMLPTL